MYDILEGVRVVEVAGWVFVPSAGAVLADWGADVIKVEDPLTGDPYRGLSNAFATGDGFNPHTAQVNRGKRSVGVDISSPDGREILDALIRTADVFMTSFRAPARQHLRIEVDDVRAVNPDIIYARGSGQGSLGPDADKGGYDLASTWARSGMADRLQLPDGAPANMPGSIGDLTSGVAAAGAIAAALFRRERSGVAPTVEVSLYGMGIWIMCQSIVSSQFGEIPPMTFREDAWNPLVNCFRTEDDRWIYFVLMQADRFWADLCHRMKRADLITDARFVDDQQRHENSRECVRVLDEIFATRTLDEWSTALETFDGVWCPVQSPSEVPFDPQVVANGYFPAVDGDRDPSAHLVASPMQFNDRPIGTLQPEPEHGQDTELILLELGFTWDEIARLKEAHAII